MSFDRTKPLHVVYPERIKLAPRKCRFIGGPVELRAGTRWIIYVEKCSYDDAYIGNCDDDGNVGNPFGTHIDDFGKVVNA